MFTGLVQKVGTVEKTEKKGRDLTLTLRAPGFFKGVKKGGSVAVNGCCLTAVQVSPGSASFQAVPETLRRTDLGKLTRGSKVNLELPLRASDPVGGHYVQGHVDGTAKVLGSIQEGTGKRLRVKVPGRWAPYLASKGSLALEGVSLTLAWVKKDVVEVVLVPHTLKHTNLAQKKSGDLLNLEVDVLAKQVANFLKKDKGMFTAKPQSPQRRSLGRKTGRIS